MDAKVILKALCIIGFIFDAVLVTVSIRKRRKTEAGREEFQKEKKYVKWNALVSFISNFFDTLGIGSYATALHGSKLIIGVVCNFVLGALMNIGVGLYAPCMALVALLGMNVQAAFPIMMGSCAYLMGFGSTPVFVKQERYDMVAVITNATIGCLGVITAYVFVKSLPLKILTWLVAAVVLLTAVLFLKDTKMKNASVAAA